MVRQRWLSSVNLCTSNLEPLKSPEGPSWTSSLAFSQILTLSRCKSLHLHQTYARLGQLMLIPSSPHSNSMCIITCKSIPLTTVFPSQMNYFHIIPRFYIFSNNPVTLGELSITIKPFILPDTVNFNEAGRD